MLFHIIVNHAPVSVHQAQVLGSGHTAGGAHALGGRNDEGKFAVTNLAVHGVCAGMGRWRARRRTKRSNRGNRFSSIQGGAALVRASTVSGCSFLAALAERAAAKAPAQLLGGRRGAAHAHAVV